MAGRSQIRLTNPENTTFYEKRKQVVPRFELEGFLRPKRTEHALYRHAHYVHSQCITVSLAVQVLRLFDSLQRNSVILFWPIDFHGHCTLSRVEPMSRRHGCRSWEVTRSEMFSRAHC